MREANSHAVSRSRSAVSTSVTHANRPVKSVLRVFLLIFAVVFLAPIAISAALYYARSPGADWRLADRSSAGLLPSAAAHPDAVVRVFSARTVSWRGIVATHSWIVVKETGASAYQRFDYTAWGGPIWIDRFVPDGRWFGSVPDVVFAADGDAAQRVIPAVRAAIKTYPFANPGDYRLWPGPNSNTFVAAVMGAIPDMRASLPATAIGKDYPYDGRWFGLTPSGTGVRLNLGGYFGITLGLVEGFELNLFGAVAGLDLLRPGLKLPGLGRVGV